MSGFPVLVLVAAVASAACASHRSGPVRSTDRLASELALLVDTLAAPSASLPGALLRVEAPTLCFAWTRAVGTMDLATGELLRPGQTLRIASNTKTFVAAAILRLVEDGEFDVDGSIGPLIEPASARLLEGGGYDPQQITVRMLLQHTGGLFDYAGAEPFLGRIAAEPGHRWTRTIAEARIQSDRHGWVYHAGTGNEASGAGVSSRADSRSIQVDVRRHG